MTQDQERRRDACGRPDWVTRALREARVARLATQRVDGGVRLVPICFALVGDRLVSAVDHKPKRTTRLGRLDDIATSGSATVLVDHYDEDWTRLWWVRVSGAATVHVDDETIPAALAALADKYAQYRDRPPAGPVYSVCLDDVAWWRVAPAE